MQVSIVQQVHQPHNGMQSAVLWVTHFENEHPYMVVPQLVRQLVRLYTDPDVGVVALLNRATVSVAHSFSSLIFPSFRNRL